MGPVAERASGEALAAGARQASALSHPERAAAWLRARAARSLRHESRSSSIPEDARRAALAKLGVSAQVYDILAALNLKQRTAIVASAIERFEPMDVETILGGRPAAAHRALAEARANYLRIAAGQLRARPSADPRALSGVLGSRIREAADHALSAGSPAQ